MELMPMKFGKMFFVLLSLFLSISSVRAQEPQLIDETVARVNTDIITRSMLVKAQTDFKEELKRRYPDDQSKQQEEYDKSAPRILDILIEDRLINQRAAELSIDVEPEINRRLLEFIKQTNPQWGLKEFEDALKQQGVDIEEIRKSQRTELQRQIIIFREVVNPIFDKLTDTEKREWYEKHIDDFRLPGEIKLSEIFIPFEGRSLAEAEALAKQVVTEARANKPFAELAKAYSDPKRPSAQKGGELPTLKDNEIKESLRKLVDKMKPGDVSDPIRTDNGFQVIRLNEYKAPGVVQFSEVENGVAERLAYEKGAEKIKDYFSKLREKAYIRIAEPYKQSVAANPN
jgi:peptidyl-prolyl cis-trans isomerase SurA